MTAPRRLRLGTRGSLLARTQSGHVADAIRASDPAIEIETVLVRTEGDRRQEHPIAPGRSLPKGLFTGALEEALRDGRIDFAVHSLKDLPAEVPDGLTIAAIPPRADARDALLSNGPCFAELAPAARVATGSPRRVAQMRFRRPDLDFVPVHGNVDTRIRKLRDGEFGAIVLAMAGLDRLGRGAEAIETFALDVVLPAPGQGALAVESRDDEVAEFLRERLDDPWTRAAVTAERAVLLAAGGGCSLPLGAHAEVDGDRLRLRAVLFSEDLEVRVERGLEGAVAAAAGVGAEVGAALVAGLRRGGGR